MIIPVILAGGSGTRLWPLSRQLYPKQLMTLVGDGTMLQHTVQRLQGLSAVEDPIVLCNDAHRFMVAEQLRKIGVSAATIILEPVGRNTAPAVAVAALAALQKDADAVLVVLPADHFIHDIPLFQKVLTCGQILAREDFLITFGVVPAAPETGYGYIKKGRPVPAPALSKDDPADCPEAVNIDSFVEKPDLETAERYLTSGQYCWNSGMFMFKANRVVAELERLAPEIVAACRRAVDNGFSDLDFFRLGADAFEACPSDSIDYAVMEKTDSGVMIPLDAGWNDLGSWEALWETGGKNSESNVLLGDVIAHEVTNSYLRSDDRLIAAVGLDDHIVVETADAVLVSPRHRAQDVKHIVDRLKDAGRIEAQVHTVDYRPWGACERLVATDRFCVNRLMINPKQMLSLQKHAQRAEHWVVLSGAAKVTKGDKVFTLAADQSLYIPPGTPHRLENPGTEPLDVIEVQTGAVIRAEDIDRLEDLYGR